LFYVHDYFLQSHIWLEGLDMEGQCRERILPEHTVSIKVSVETENKTFDKKPTEIWKLLVEAKTNRELRVLGQGIKAFHGDLTVFGRDCLRVSVGVDTSMPSHNDFCLPLNNTLSAIIREYFFRIRFERNWCYLENDAFLAPSVDVRTLDLELFGDQFCEFGWNLNHFLKNWNLERFFF